MLLAGLVSKVPKEEKYNFVDQLLHDYPNDLSIHLAAMDASDTDCLLYTSDAADDLLTV